MEITKEQVLKLHIASGYLNASYLEKWFPEAFKVELEVGKVYKYKGLKTLIKITKIHLKSFDVYGFNYKGDYKTWLDSDNINDDKWQEATTDEWESALIEEAKKRGYNNGNYKCLYQHGNSLETDGNIHMFEGSVWIGNGVETNQVFKKGVWAEIVKTISKEEAEKQLGCKII